MEYCELSQSARQRRKEIARETRQMVSSLLPIAEQDETSLMSDYRGYYIQISFSELHPLMVLCLARVLKSPSTSRQRQMINELNLQSILGSHAINDEVGCYSYRATQWLDVQIDPQRFYEILNRCIEEADRGYYRLMEG